MRQWIKFIMAASLLAAASVAVAKPEGKGHQGKLQMEEHMSERGAANTNSPNAGDQDKGAARVEERKAMAHGQDADTQPSEKGQGGKGHEKGGKGQGKGKHK